MKYWLPIALLFLVNIANLHCQELIYHFDTQKEFEEILLQNSLDPLEGIYSVSILHSYYDLSGNFANSDIAQNEYKVGILKGKDGNFLLYDIEDTDGVNLLYSELQPTAVDNIFIFNNSNLQETAIAKFNDGLIEYSIDKIGNAPEDLRAHYSKCIFTYSLIKLFPITQNNINPSICSSGTCFAISRNGILVTNYHVIDGARSINIRGINLDFNKTYNAKILIVDKNNDIALIQIDDPLFTTISGTIPYIIKPNLSSVGESVFVLGYPLRATMGDEIKLTNGIISSQTGFQGEISSYQVSAPVQPGNSGGPLFNMYGNVIGIINAKHTGAENVSYAIKISYLINLIELLPAPPGLQTVNTLSGKTFIQIVDEASSYIYIIETK